MVYNLLGLVSESNRVKDWRCETLPTSRAVLFGVDLRGLHARMYLEPHRTGTTDTDVYCLALKQSSHQRQSAADMCRDWECFAVRTPTEKNPQLGELNAEAQPNRERYKREN